MYKIGRHKRVREGKNTEGVRVKDFSEQVRPLGPRDGSLPRLKFFLFGPTRVTEYGH